MKTRIDIRMEEYKKNKILGSMFGGAIGDALGYQIEFKKNIKEREYTKYQNDFGIISDDTQMTLFTANALLWRENRLNSKGIAPEMSDVFFMAYKDWLDTQNNTKNNNPSISWLRNVEELNQRRAPGNTCLSALSNGIKGTIKEPINDSKGCGGIMRVAPIGLYIKSPLYAGKFASEASAITHGNPLGIIPSYVFATMINMILNEKLDIEQALYKAIKQYKKKFKVYGRKIRKEFIKLIEKAVDLSKQNISDIEAIKELGEGWVAEETFAIAIYSCLKYQNSFEDAIICSINHDGDSDSTGAVAGNIMGVYLGYNKIPSYYIDNLELKDIILEVSKDLMTPIHEMIDNEYWISKYSKNFRDVSLIKD